MVPVPARITLALDMRDLSGDQVDWDLGVWESPADEWIPGTAVDRWEVGALVHTRAQVERLALLTAFLVTWFYRPVEHLPSRMLLCDRSKRARALTILTGSVNADGVLQRSSMVRLDRRPRSCRGVHPVCRDWDTGLCVCGLPDRNRWHAVEGLPPDGEESTYDPQRLAAGERPTDP